jgi:maleate isomerase
VIESIPMKVINYGTRARLGMLLPSRNQAAEPQFNAMLPAGVSLHTTRLKLRGSSEADLLAMTERVEEAAELVADSGADLVVFHCTAVTTFSLDLEQSIKERVARASGKPATTTAEAIVTALETLCAQRIVLLSPYIEAVNAREAAFFRGAGFESLDYAGLDCRDANAMMAVTPARWREFARAHKNKDAQAYLISCTTVRSAEVIEDLERELGRPVVTSNTAAVWHCLRSMGIPDKVAGFGCLLTQH